MEVAANFASLLFAAEREALHLAGLAVGVTEAVLHVSKDALTGAEQAAEEVRRLTEAYCRFISVYPGWHGGPCLGMSLGARGLPSLVKVQCQVECRVVRGPIEEVATVQCSHLQLSESVEHGVELGSF